jgi:hypothetical protein
LNNLALLFLATKRLPLAKSTFQEALSILETSYGSNHAITKATSLNLSRVAALLESPLGNSRGNAELTQAAPAFHAQDMTEGAKMTAEKSEAAQSIREIDPATAKKILELLRQKKQLAGVPSPSPPLAPQKQYNAPDSKKAEPFATDSAPPGMPSPGAPHSKKDGDRDESLRKNTASLRDLDTGYSDDADESVSPESSLPESEEGAVAEELIMSDGKKSVGSKVKSILSKLASLMSPKEKKEKKEKNVKAAPGKKKSSPSLLSEASAPATRGRSEDKSTQPIEDTSTREHKKKKEKKSKDRIREEETRNESDREKHDFAVTSNELEREEDRFDLAFKRQESGPTRESELPTSQLSNSSSSRRSSAIALPSRPITQATLMSASASSASPQPPQSPGSPTLMKGSASSASPQPPQSPGSPTLMPPSASSASPQPQSPLPQQQASPSPPPPPADSSSESPQKVLQRPLLATTALPSPVANVPRQSATSRPASSAARGKALPPSLKSKHMSGRPADLSTFHAPASSLERASDDLPPSPPPATSAFKVNESDSEEELFESEAELDAGAVEEAINAAEGADGGVPVGDVTDAVSAAELLDLLTQSVDNESLEALLRSQAGELDPIETFNFGLNDL